MKTFKSIGCDGQVLVIVTIVLIVLIAFVGLAIDSGRGYGVKAKLNAAVDAASIAATKALSEGEDEARQTAGRYFYGNYPDGYLSSSPEFDPDNIDITASSDGNVIVTVSGRAEMPTTFMRVLGYESLNVRARAQVTRKAVDIAFVVDNTSSLISPTDVREQVKTASKYFVSKFIPAYDRFGLIKYAFGAEVSEEIRGKSSNDRGFNDSKVNTEIDNFVFTGPGGTSNYTNSSEGFLAGLNELRQISPENRSNLRVIVFFTDGAPNTFASEFNFQSADPHTGSIRSGDSSSGIPAGLWKHNFINVQSDPPYNYNTNIYNQLHATQAFPRYYNAHGDDGNNGDNFPVLNPYHPLRPVTQYNPSGTAWQIQQQLYIKVNRVARNLLEDIAAKARQEGIYVFTLGLGSRLTIGSGPQMENGDQEIGEDLLIRMANLNDADGTGIIGEYCYAGAETQEQAEENLFNCYDRLSSAILRLTM